VKTASLVAMLSMLWLGCDCKSATGSGGGGGGGGATGGGGGGDAGAPFDAGASVFQHHRDNTHGGVYVDPAFTHAAVSTLHLAPNFPVVLDGAAYAQPLFIDGALDGGGDGVLVATEHNVIELLDAASGQPRWSVTLAPPVALSKLPCGNIDPLGITGTPYLDLPARTVYLDAMTTPDNGTTKKHQLYAISLDTGAVKSGWPIDVETALSGHDPAFTSASQNQRGALAMADGVIYVPYAGHAGDCSTYYGWVIGVDVRFGNAVVAFNTAAKGGGMWSPGGISADETHLFVASGNTFNASNWGGGDGVYRFTRGPLWSSASADYWAPANWVQLDNSDLDMAAVLPFDAPAVSPSALVAAFGKDGNIYLLNRGNLGGIGGELTSLGVGTGELNGAGTAYTSDAGTFLAVRVDGNGAGGVSCTNNGTGNLIAVKVTAGPTIQPAWCATHGGLGVPSTSMTAPGQNPIVWTFGSDHLYAYDGETGDELFAGGGAGGAITTPSYFNTPMIAKGRVYVATKDRLYVFVP